MTKEERSTESATYIDFTCSNCGATNRLPRERLVSMAQVPSCGRCDTVLFKSYGQKLEHIAPAAYIHPLDHDALESLKRIPGVSTLLRSLIRHSFELATRLHHHANFVQVSETQLPSVWNAFQYCAERLDIKELPDLYVYQDPVPNAYTFGVEKCFIAVSTGALDLLDEEELRVLLAHELGHVHAEHVLFKSAARVFGSVASTITSVTLGVGSLVVQPVQIALARWDRASELSSDRAALLVSQKPDVVIRTLMKVAGGSERLSSELNIEAFIEQADRFGELQEEGPFGRYIAVFQTLFRSHPFPIWRAKEILDWVTTGNYLEILDGEYLKQTDVDKIICQHCHAENRAQAWLCSQCGKKLNGHNRTDEDDDESDPASDLLEGGVEKIGKAVDGLTSWMKNRFSDDTTQPKPSEDEEHIEEIDLEKITHVVETTATEDKNEDHSQ